MIIDLEATDLSEFLTEASSWTLSNEVCPSCNQTFTTPPNLCGVDREIIYGGPNILGPSGQNQDGEYYQRIYPGMTGMTYAAISFDWWIFSSNTNIPGDIDVKLNGNTIQNYNSGTQTFCQYNLNYQVGPGVVVKSLYKYPVTGWFYLGGGSGSSSSLDLQFVSQISSSSAYASFGIKNIRIYKTGYESSASGSSFPCANDDYWDGTACIGCHTNCQACYGPTQNECTVCRNGNANYNNGTCISSCTSPFFDQWIGSKRYCFPKCPDSYYWASNSSCSPTCDPPFEFSIDSNNLNLCSNPCYGTGKYLYPNGSCITGCPSPLTSTYSAGSLCVNPCYTEDLYLYANKSCLSTCPSPLLVWSIPNITYCYNPCSTGQFLYPNSSCLSSCDLPLVTDTWSGVKFCRSPCQSTEYLFLNGSCKATCPQPLVNRIITGVQYCYSPCSTSQPYLYLNGSCFPSCESPLVIQTEPVVQYCRNPCQPDEYLYLNGSCFATCPQPLHIRTTPNTKYCYNPCDISTQYLFDDGSCITSCDPPLLTIQEPQVQYCRNPCYGTNNYLYSNHSCIATCPLPLFSRFESSLNSKYCENPCSQNSTFLHYNQSCQTLCPSPMIIRKEAIANFCLLPCENPDDYFFESTGKCQKTCDSPYTAIDSSTPKLCISSLSQEEVQQVKQMAAATSTAGTAADTGVMVFSVISSSDSTAICMGPISKMLQYIKFMDINYPEKVVLMLEQQSENSNSGGFTGKMMGGALEKFPNHKLPRRFTTYKVHSSFFVNYWPTLFNLLVIFIVTFAVIILSWQTKNSPKLNGILQGLLEILKWNVVLITFCGSLGDVVLYTALEFQTMQFDNFEAVLSFLLCLIINFLAIFVVVKILEVNLTIRKSKKDHGFTEDQIEKQWCSYKALFECYRDSSYYQQIFLFVFIIRLALFNGIIGYLYNYPLFQAVVFTLINILMLGYLVIKRPMRKLVSLIQQIILELVLLPFNACVLALAIMDKHRIEGVGHRKSIGNVIFYINLSVPFLSLVLMVVKFVAIGIEFYQQRKAAKLNKLKKFNIEISRQTNTTLNTTQDILPTQTLSSPTFNNKTAGVDENIQVFDGVDFTRSPENSLIFLKPRRNPTLPRSNNSKSFFA